MRNHHLIPAVLTALLALPSFAAAQSAGSLLDEARSSVASMKQSVAHVRKLAEGAKGTDRVKYDCVNESYQSMQRSTQRADATVEAAAGWGVDVAAAALEAVRGAQTQVQRMRADANRCVGVEEDADALAEEQRRSAEGAPADDDAYAEAGEGAEGAGDESDDLAWYDPFASSALPTAGSIALRGRPPAASPTK